MKKVRPCHQNPVGHDSSERSSDVILDDIPKELFRFFISSFFDESRQFLPGILVSLVQLFASIQILSDFFETNAISAKSCEHLVAFIEPPPVIFVGNDAGQPDSESDDDIVQGELLNDLALMLSTERSSSDLQSLQ